MGKVAPYKKRTHRIVEIAIQKGELKRPENCECCGFEDYVYAHHPNYTKPLEVIWLCRYCHHLYHSVKNFIERHIIQALEEVAPISNN